MRTIAGLATVLALLAPAAAQAAPVGESTLQVGSLHTRLLEAGDSRSREAVVFVHGHPGSSLEYRHLVGEAGDFGRAVAFDMPGFGRASKDANFDYSVAGEAKFLGQALDALGITRVHLVLHDFGGPFGLEWAKTHGDRLASVVLLNTGVFENYYGHPYAYAYNVPGLGEAMMDSETHDSFTLQMQAGNPRPLPQDFLDAIWNEYDAATRAAALKLYRSFGSPTAASDMGYAQAAELRKTPHPALVIWGEFDPYVPAYVAYEQSDAFPGARVELLDSAHWPFVDNVAKVDALVLPFWREHVHPDVPAAAPAARAKRRARGCAKGRRAARGKSQRACRRRR